MVQMLDYANELSDGVKDRVLGLAIKSLAHVMKKYKTRGEDLWRISPP